jgi:hypothetical protein
MVTGRPKLRRRDGRTIVALSRQVPTAADLFDLEVSAGDMTVRRRDSHFRRALAKPAWRLASVAGIAIADGSGHAQHDQA